MISLKKIFFSLVVILISSFYSIGSHVSGANITYAPTGVPNQYLITLTLYRDCSGIPAPGGVGGGVTINFWNDCDGTTAAAQLVQQSLNEVSAIDTTYCPDSTTCNGGTMPGMEQYTYQGIVELPVACADWHMSYSLNARNNATNVTGGTMYIESSINTSNNITNTSPTLIWSPTNGFDPIPYACVNSPKSYALNVVEPDGDSLVFSLVNPLTGPNINIGYVGGYSALSPIPGLTINSTTGQIDFTATIAGIFVITILIEEFNANGVLVGSIMHDFQIVVESCLNNDPVAPNNVVNFTNVSTNAILDTANNTISMCDGDAFCFDVTFTDPNGDSIALQSNAPDILPGATFTYTYISADTVIGTVCWTYTNGYSGSIINITAKDLICIPGTSTFSIGLDIPPALNLTPNDSICGNQVAEIFASGQGPLTWSVISGDPIVLGTNFSCNGCPSPIATPAITTTYLLSDASSCLLTDVVTVTVANNFGDVVADILSNDTLICPGECVNVDGLAQEDFTGTNPYPYTGTTDYFVNTNSTITSPLFVVAFPPPSTTTTVAQNTIKEVCINIDHDNDSDLDISLIAPNGSVFVLSAGNGATLDDYTNTCFTQNAFIPITSAFAPFTGNFIPQGGPIGSAAIGSSIQGVWSLSVTNNSGSDFGLLTDWSITFCDPFDFPIAASFLSWDNPDGMPATPSSDPSICPTVGGQYTLTAFNIDMCWDTASFSINVLPLPNPGVDSIVEVCIDAGVIDLFNYLGGTPDVAGTWVDSSGTIVNPIANANTIIDNIPYLYIAQTAAGCVDTAILTVDIINPLITDTLLTDASCFSIPDGAISVIGQSTASYSLNGATAINVNTFPNLGAGTYDITAYSQQNGMGCSIDLLGIIIEEPPQLIITNHTALLTGDTVTCVEDQLPLFATGTGGDGNYVYTWFHDNNNIGTGAVLTTPVNSPGEVCVVLSEGACPQDTNCFMIANPPTIYPKFTTNKNDGCAELQGVIFTSAITNPSEVSSIVWQFSNGQTIFDSPSAPYTFVEPGMYDVKMIVESIHGCEYDTLYVDRIEVFDLPRVNFTANPIQSTIYEPNTTMVNLSGSDATSFVWNFGSDGTPTSSMDYEPFVSFPEGIPGRYSISLTGISDNDCPTTVVGEIIVINDVQLFAANVFTPDGNSFNERWGIYISGINVYDFELTVFNRYGKIVWRSLDPAATWDGRYGNNGDVVQDGTYPYIIIAKDAVDDRKYEFSGTVTIIR